MHSPDKNTDSPPQNKFDRVLTNPCTLAIAVIIILFIRAQDALHTPQFWAEDGDVFWLKSYTHGINSLIMPFAGYLHTTQRIAAWLISVFPYATQPLLYSLCGALLTAWTAVTIATTLPNRRLGTLIGLALVLVRHDIGELYLTLVNVQWIMACALPFIIVSPQSTSKLWRYNQLFFLCLATLTGPFSVMFIPFWFIKCTRIPKINHPIVPLDKTVGFIGYMGGILQFFILLFHGSGDTFTLSLSQFPIMWLRLFSDTFGIDRSWPFSIIIVCIILASLLWPRYRMLRLTGLCFLAIIALSTAFKFGSYDESFLSPNSLGPRYFYIPAVMLAAISLSFFFEKKSILTYSLGTALSIGLILGSINGGFIRDAEFRGLSTWANEAHKIGKEEVTIKSTPKYYPAFTIPKK